MGQQSDIKFCGKVLDEESWELVLELTRDFWGIPRTELAHTICELLDWRRPNGKLKTVECSRFLNDLEDRGLIGLPRKRREGRPKSTGVVRTERGKEAEPVRGTPKTLGNILLEQITNPEQMKTFKELVDRYHYLGYKQAFGAQLRYLVKYGAQQRILGCLQFSSPAWKVTARDQWIGWDSRGREAGLQRIVQNSRFLILPWVEVKNLASHVLGLATKRLPDDWQEMYGQRPLLMETFVEARFSGTSYRAANWIELGRTTGRGRMDQYHRHAGTVKTVWVYPLHRQARLRLAKGSP
jgi:hypothetical protein